MRFGLKDPDFAFLKQHLVDLLKAEGLKVYIFGSRANGKNHPFSDIDILLEGNIDPELELKISHIKELFEESNFPIKVDLVIEENLAKSYRSSVMSERIEI